jgi:hypothetical protein
MASGAFARSHILRLGLATMPGPPTGSKKTVLSRRLGPECARTTTKCSQNDNQDTERWNNPVGQPRSRSDNGLLTEHSDWTAAFSHTRSASVRWYPINSEFRLRGWRLR